MLELSSGNGFIEPESHRFVAAGVGCLAARTVTLLKGALHFVIRIGKNPPALNPVQAYPSLGHFLRSSEQDL